MHFIGSALLESLSLWERWHCGAMTERARMLTEKLTRGDSIALTKSLLIAVRKLFYTGLALSVTFGDTSPKGRGFCDMLTHHL